MKLLSLLKMKGAPVSSIELLLKLSQMSGSPEVLGKAPKQRLEVSVLMRLWTVFTAVAYAEATGHYKPSHSC